jgi:hypothetical protein
LLTFRQSMARVRDHIILQPLFSETPGMLVSQ